MGQAGHVVAHAGEGTVEFAHIRFIVFTFIRIKLREFAQNFQVIKSWSVLLQIKECFTFPFKFR